MYSLVDSGASHVDCLVVHDGILAVDFRGVDAAQTRALLRRHRGWPNAPHSYHRPQTDSMPDYSGEHIRQTSPVKLSLSGRRKRLRPGCSGETERETGRCTGDYGWSLVAIRCRDGRGYLEENSGSARDCWHSCSTANW